MLSFKEFIVEDLNELPKTHYNPGVGTMKTLAANAKGKRTIKFFISRGGNITVGDSYFYTHHSLGAHTTEIHGAITHNSETDTYHYDADKYNSGSRVRANHPLLQNMESLGIKRGRWDNARETIKQS